MPDPKNKSTVEQLGALPAFRSMFGLINREEAEAAWKKLPPLKRAYWRLRGKAPDQVFGE